MAATTVSVSGLREMFVTIRQTYAALLSALDALDAEGTFDSETVIFVRLRQYTKPHI